MAIKLRTFVFVLIILFVVIFAAANWQLFTQTSTMNVLIGTVVAPLGIVMLAIVGGLSLLYLLLLGKIETSALVGNRRTAKELEEARKLAMNAEESRFAEMREDIGARLARIEERVDEIHRRAAEAPVRREVVVEQPPSTVAVPPARGEII